MRFFSMYPARNLAARAIPDARRGGGGQGNPTATVPQWERDALYEHVRDTLAGLGLQDQEIQHELARWVELLETSGRDLRVDNKSKEQVLARLVRQAGAAISAFLSDSPEVVFAPTLRVEAENKLLRHNG
jgi:hypothetical protein